MNDRYIAYRLLRKNFKKGFYESDFYEAFSYVEEKAFFKEIVYGVLRRQEYLDWVINKFLKKSEIPPSIRVLLRMGVYQLFFSSIPAYAVINETVNMVENRSFRGLVNAVLRRISEQGYIEPVEQYLKYSHPKWLLEYWESFLPQDYLMDLLKYNLLPAKVVARVNVRKMARDDIKIPNISFTEHSPYGIVFGAFNNSPWDLKEYKEGKITFQSESSQLIPLILDFQKGENVLDACASPGGKATHILELADVNLFVNDISFQKVKTVEKQMERLGFTVKSTISDARNLKEKYNKIFDKIFVDAPCSGFGTARKNPEVMRRQKYKDIKKLSTLQREILNETWKLLKKGGKMVYSTCTITKEENTDTVLWFIGKKKAKVIDIRKILDGYGVKYLWDGVGALFYPEEVLTPFYVAVFEK